MDAVQRERCEAAGGRGRSEWRVQVKVAAVSAARAVSAERAAPPHPLNTNCQTTRRLLNQPPENTSSVPVDKVRRRYAQTLPQEGLRHVSIGGEHKGTFAEIFSVLVIPPP
ncbi:hypothetical protein EYF80_023804 [Liparis tanakae]|uniref:Uncharacterized protein n=1 Tax=Liparis tanakae TaxID=230148 RepID=A0A4Z2HK06_9TELE|nr:hypothetical protein EYF80_023804 [Liparis tanakae]